MGESKTIIVIQCAKSKKNHAGHLVNNDGRKVLFVARPEEAHAREGHIFARPDDDDGTGVSWRNRLLEHNENSNNNPLGLLTAVELYRNATYERLARHYGHENLYILSAGWGLIAADFLTPAYDITFSNSAESCQRRRQRDIYCDFHMLPDDTSERVIFLGGKSYVELFCSLTGNVKGKRYVFHVSQGEPQAPKCFFKRFETTTRTNWHYECARALIEDRIGI